MRIANPIYDVVFKYLMEDDKISRLFLSVLTGLDIFEIEFLPQELTSESKDGGSKRSINSGMGLSIYRLDFSAKVKLSSGEEKVIIIEVQKSKYTHENMRFRKYLGKQYLNDGFFQWMTSHSGRKFKSGLPILPIYFMGENMEGYEGIPVIEIGKTVKDRYTKESLSGEHPFIESLFHDGIIVNIPSLSKKRRDEIEILLSIFDQENRTENHHIMNVIETDFPEKFRPIIRRLQAATETKKIRDIMTVEDDFLAELNDIEHQTVQERKLKDAALKQLEEERRQKEEAVKKQEVAVKKQEEAVKKQEEAVKKQEEAVKKQEEAIKLLHKMGMTLEDISNTLDISIESIIKII